MRRKPEASKTYRRQGARLPPCGERHPERADVVCQLDRHLLDGSSHVAWHEGDLYRWANVPGDVHAGR